MPDLLTFFDQTAVLSPIGFAVVALAGLVMGVAPSSLPLYSIVVGYVSGQEAERVKARARGAYLSLGFVLGMATVDAAVGALFGFLGSVVIETLTSYLLLTNLVLALLLVVLGLVLLRRIRIVWPALRPMMRRVDNFRAAYALGISHFFL